MVEELVDRLRADGRRVGSTRLRLLELLADAQAPLSADEIAAQVPGLSVSTVYRTLAMLEQLGVLVHSHLDQRVAAYSMAAGSTPDPRLVCQGCRQRRPLPAAVLRSARRVIECDHRFSPNFAHFAIVGLCADCQSTTPRSFAHAHS